MVMPGTSNADDAMAISNAQLQVHKLMQDFALPRPGLMSGMLAPPGGALLPLASHGGPGPNEQLALVPVMIQNPDGTFTGAYQVQPYPSGFSTDGAASEMTGDLLLMVAARFVQVFLSVAKQGFFCPLSCAKHHSSKRPEPYRGVLHVTRS